MVNIGDKVKVRIYKKGANRKTRIIEKEGLIVDKTKDFFVLNNGKYRETVSIFDIISGKVVLIIGGERVMPKITKEQLLEECVKHGGFNVEIAKSIAEKYELAELTVKTYFSKWNIGNVLDMKIYEAEKKADKPNEVKEADSSKSKTSVLRPTVFRGKVMEYRLEGVYIEIANINTDSNDNTICIDFGEISDFVKEVQELENIAGICGCR